MNNKIKIILEDDNEILGNGNGHPVYRQYLPTKKYVELLNKYNIKGTFYIDIAHYLFLNENKSIQDFKFQAYAIEQTIQLLIKNKMDVQIHLHSQWVNAKVVNSKVEVTNKWNIGQLKPDEQKLLFEKAYHVLSNLLNGSEGCLNSYKAGSWGLQPFEFLYDVFKDKGIKLVMGPIKGLKVKELNVDYTSLASDYYPFFTNQKDINSISGQKDIVVLPMTPTYLNWFDFIRYMYEIKIKSLFQDNKDIDTIDLEAKNLFNPLKGKDKLNISFRPFKTHLKINAQKFWYLKNTFNRSYKMIKKSDHDYKLLVIETHTKDFKNTFDDIDRFLGYIIGNYSDVEFVTTSDIVSDIEKNILKPLKINE